MQHYPYKFKLSLQVTCFAWLVCFGLLFGSVESFAQPALASLEQDRRTARVQATYLTHLVNFTYWQEGHLPESGESPKVVILGGESRGFVQSLRFLVRQRALKISGQLVELHHFDIGQETEAEKMLSDGCQVVFLLGNSSFSPAQVRSLTTHAVIFGEGRGFVTEKSGDVSFIVSRNRVKLVVSEKYFRRTSPKLSSKLANLKSVVEIYPPR
tara:strand:- start:167 stop:802 length:636 start_codon:yes stop_codon:yes gene_type:complete